MSTEPDTSPAGRAAYLRSIMPPAGPSTLEQISDAERAVELCEADNAEAETWARTAAHELPEMAQARELTPAQRSAWGAWREAHDHHARTLAALAEAKRNLYSLLAEYDLELGNLAEARYHETLAGERSGPWHL